MPFKLLKPQRDSCQSKYTVNINTKKWSFHFYVQTVRNLAKTYKLFVLLMKYAQKTSADPSLSQWYPDFSNRRNLGNKI